MVKALIGNISRHNQYILDEIFSQYNKALIIKRNTTKSFKNWFSSIKRPILGGRILVNINEMGPIGLRDYESFLQLIAPLKDHKYVDILWCIPKIKGVHSLQMPVIDVIELDNNKKEDFIRTVSIMLKTSFNSVDEKSVERLLSRTGLNWENIDSCLEDAKRMALIKTTKGLDEKYEYFFLNKQEIQRLNLPKMLVPLTDVLMDVLNRKSSGLKNYYLYSNKYGRTWVNQYFTETLEEVLKLKFKYYLSKELTMTDINNNQKIRKYSKFISQTVMIKVYNLLNLLRTEHNPLEVYYNFQDRDIINIYYEEEN